MFQRVTRSTTPSVGQARSSWASPARLGARSRSGRSLDEEAPAFAEPSFSLDLGRVRVHAAPAPVIQRQPDEGAAPQPAGEGDAEPLQNLKPGVCNHPDKACSAADTLTGEQVVCAAKKAGFTGDSLKTAVALAKAESGWDRCCFSSTYDLGLWQINQVHFKTYGGRDKLYNADTNARAAFDISKKGTSFKPWSAFNNGSYKKFLTEAQQAIDTAKCDAKSDGKPEEGAPAPAPTPAP